MPSGSPNPLDYSYDNDFIPAHSDMYWEGYYAALDMQPCVAPYTPGSEAWDDYVGGYAEYKNNVWTPDL